MQVNHQNNSCPHEDDIQYGKTVYKTKLVHVILVTCSTCNGSGTVVELWSEDQNDYVEVAEEWHGKATSN